MTTRARFRILWIILGLMVISIGCLIGFNYYNLLHSYKQQVLSKRKAVTYTASLQFDIEAHRLSINEIEKAINSTGYNCN